MNAALPGRCTAPKAKSLIYLHMNGGPSQIHRSLGHSSLLKDHFYKELPDSVRNGQRLSTMTSGQTRFPVAPSKYKFEQKGQCGRWINTDLLPHTAKIVDDIALVKTVNTNAINHDPALHVRHDRLRSSRQSQHRFVVSAYGLGSENNDLPAFIVLRLYLRSSRTAQGALHAHGPAAIYNPLQWREIQRGGGSSLVSAQPDGVTSSDRRTMLDALNKLNQRGFENFGDPGNSDPVLRSMKWPSA